MPAYNEIFSQVEQLKPDEQLRLLAELAALIRRQVTPESSEPLQTPSKPNLERWFGFLPQSVDALEFQLTIRQEWDREIGNGL